MKKSEQMRINELCEIMCDNAMREYDEEYSNRSNVPECQSRQRERLLKVDML